MITLDEVLKAVEELEKTPAPTWPDSVKVRDLAPEFPLRLSPAARANLAKSIKSTFHVAECGCAHACQYLSRICLEKDVGHLAVALGSVLNEVEAKFGIVGAMAPPSYLKLEGGKCAVFCFLFTRATNEQLLELCPSWVAPASGVADSTTWCVPVGLGTLLVSELRHEVYSRVFTSKVYSRESWDGGCACAVVKTSSGYYPWPWPKSKADLEDLCVTFAIEMESVEELFLPEEPLKALLAERFRGGKKRRKAKKRAS